MSSTDPAAGPTEAGVIAELTKAGLQPAVVQTGDGRSFLVTHKDLHQEEITDPHGMVRIAPVRIRQAVTLQTVDSLVDYARRFAEASTTIFADIEANSLRAAIDYHDPGAPAFADHNATLKLPFSVEWGVWTAISGKLMGQLDFARFIEENAADIVAPDGADLLEVARDLHAVRSADFRRVVRTAGEDESFEYQESTEAKTKGGTLEVPSRFQLGIPVYFGQPAVTVFAFLRWKLDDGKLLIGVTLHRAEHVRQAVFKEIVADAAARIGRPAVFGRF